MAIWSLGYRPFFLGAAAWSALAMLAWTAMLYGDTTLPTAFAPIVWHAHEMLYGFLPAVIAGFLLTAVPNWTRRPPLTGAPLLALALLWVAGRIAVATSALVGAGVAAAVDCAFAFALTIVIGREIIAARAWRNLGIVALLGALTAGNLCTHLAPSIGPDAYGLRIGVAVAVALISVIGGRIVPAFTRNWLVGRGAAGRLPAPAARFDVVTIALGVVALGAWIAAPAHLASAVLCGAAAVLHTIRLARWAGERTGAERLVLILHIGYAFVPLGFLLVAVAAAAPLAIAPSAALHAWTAGAIGTMTLAVMTRATLGHSGRALHADATTQLLYAAVVVAGLGRALATGPAAIRFAAAAWIVAFGGFAIAYARLFILPRRDVQLAR